MGQRPPAPSTGRYIPQIAPGLATLVWSPTWTEATDKTTVVYDFSAWGEPVFAVIEWEFVTYFTLKRAAEEYTDSEWTVFPPRSQAPMSKDDVFHARPGDTFRLPSCSI